MQQIYTFLPFIIIIVLFYLMVFVPENKRKKKYNQLLGNLKLNDEIMTKGGIIGKIVNIQDDFVILQTGPEKARIKLNKNGIANVTKASSDIAVEEKKEDKNEDTKVVK